MLVDYDSSVLLHGVTVPMFCILCDNIVSCAYERLLLRELWWSPLFKAVRIGIVIWNGNIALG